MEITPIQKNELREFAKQNGLTLAFMGCDVSTPEHRIGFIDHFTQQLVNDGCVKPGVTKPEDIWASIRSLDLPNRTDLFYVTKDVFVTGRLAVVRMQYGGDLKWFDDYLDNSLYNR
jgi:hypothetical protein